MLLAIDCGNTNIVFAVYDADGAIQGSWRAQSKQDWTGQALADWLAPHFGERNIAPGDITATIIASVVPANTAPLQSLCQDHLNVPPLVVGAPDVDLGIKVLVDRPDQVGADRLVNAVAAFEKYGGPLIVVDFGTATTFDVVDADGSYAGGVISPGINLSLAALHQAAAKLPLIEVAKPPKVVGTDTLSAMQSGIYWGYVGLIEGIVARVQGETGGGAKVIATGGLATLFDGASAAIDTVDCTLTLDGLYLIYKRNTV